MKINLQINECFLKKMKINFRSIKKKKFKIINFFHFMAFPVTLNNWSVQKAHYLKFLHSKVKLVFHFQVNMQMKQCYYQL